ncbi:MAG: DUF502 domain-containing protein [Anaerolineales bacterium]|nr:DUF502 domain-containing protein [Anaerolineales bacterium]
MKKSKSVFRTNVIYGLLVLVPAAIIFLLLVKIVEILEKMAAPLNLESSTNVVVAILLGLLLLLLLCFVVGAFVRTRIGSWSLERLERKILNQIPGYEIISNMLRGFAEKRTAYPAAMVRLYGPGTAVLGFIMEENENGSLTVFVPSAPALTVGSLHVVDRERVTILEAGFMDVTNCISQWGIGLQNILGTTAK